MAKIKARLIFHSLHPCVVEKSFFFFFSFHLLEYLSGHSSSVSFTLFFFFLLFPLLLVVKFQPREPWRNAVRHKTSALIYNTLSNVAFCFVWFGLVCICVVVVF